MYQHDWTVRTHIYFYLRKCLDLRTPLNLICWFFKKIYGSKGCKMHDIKKGVMHSQSFSLLESIWPPASKLCNCHLWVYLMEPRTGDHVRWQGCAELGTAQSPVLWHFKAPSVSLLFKPLGMTHLWQCYITHNALKALAAQPWKTAHSCLILLFLGQRKHTPQLDVSMVNGLLQHSWCSPCGAEEHLNSEAQRWCLHMLLLYKHQPIMCVAMELLWCCIIQHKPNTNPTLIVALSDDSHAATLHDFSESQLVIVS